MNTSGMPLAWLVGVSVGGGLLLGYGLGMAMGVAAGKQQLLKRIRSIVAAQRLDFDVDRLLRSEHGQRIAGFGA